MDKGKCTYIGQEEYNGDIFYTCSNCDATYAFPDGGPRENDYNFCPICGFKIEDVILLTEDEEV